MSELVDEARFPHPRLADDRRHLPAPGAGQLLGPAELLQLRGPADEPGQPPPGRRLQARPRRAHPRHLVNRHRLRQPLDRHRAERRHGDVALDQVQGRARDQDAARARELFQPRRQVCRLTDRRVVHVEIAVDGPHDDLARVEPDPDLHVDTVRPARLRRVALHELLHPQRRVAGADGMVLVGHRRAEQRHDPIAHHLVDGALVAVDRLHHPLEDGVQELPGLLGIPIGEELHRAFHVGEQHRHLLALALQCGSGNEDLLGEVFGCVGLRRLEPWLAGFDERCRTLPAELVAWRIGGRA